MYRDVKCAVQPAPIQREAFAAAGGGPRLRGRLEADPEGMAACGQSLEGFAQMQCSLLLVLLVCMIIR